MSVAPPPSTFCSHSGCHPVAVRWWWRGRGGGAHDMLTRGKMPLLFCLGNHSISGWGMRGEHLTISLEFPNFDANVHRYSQYSEKAPTMPSPHCQRLLTNTYESNKQTFKNPIRNWYTCQWWSPLTEIGAFPKYCEYHVQQCQNWRRLDITHLADLFISSFIWLDEENLEMNHFA